jgi:hypothetical protein
MLMSKITQTARIGSKYIQPFRRKRVARTARTWARASNNQKLDSSGMLKNVVPLATMSQRNRTTTLAQPYQFRDAVKYFTVPIYAHRIGKTRSNFVKSQCYVNYEP